MSCNSGIEIEKRFVVDLKMDEIVNPDITIDINDFRIINPSGRDISGSLERKIDPSIIRNNNEIELSCKGIVFGSNAVEGDHTFKFKIKSNLSYEDDSINCEKEFEFVDDFYCIRIFDLEDYLIRVDFRSNGNYITNARPSALEIFNQEGLKRKEVTVRSFKSDGSLLDSATNNDLNRIENEYLNVNIPSSEKGAERDSIWEFNNGIICKEFISDNDTYFRAFADVTKVVGSEESLSMDITFYGLNHVKNFSTDQLKIEAGFTYLEGGIEKSLTYSSGETTSSLSTGNSFGEFKVGTIKNSNSNQSGTFNAVLKQVKLDIPEQKKLYKVFCRTFYRLKTSDPFIKVGEVQYEFLAILES